MKKKTLLKNKNTKVASDDLFLKIQERLKQIQDEMFDKNFEARFDKAVR